MATMSPISARVSWAAALVAGALVAGCGSDDNSKLTQGEGNGGDAGSDAASDADATSPADATLGDDDAGGDATVREDTGATGDDAASDATVSVDSGGDVGSDGSSPDAGASDAGGDGAPALDAAPDASLADAGVDAAIADAGGDAATDAGPGVGTVSVACDYPANTMYGLTNAGADPSGNLYALSFVENAGPNGALLKVDNACNPVFRYSVLANEARMLGFGASAAGAYFLTHIDFSPNFDGVTILNTASGGSGGTAVESGDWLVGLDPSGKGIQVNIAEDVLGSGGIQMAPPMPTSISIGGNSGYSEVFDGGTWFYPATLALDAGAPPSQLIFDATMGTLVGTLVGTSAGVSGGVQKLSPTTGAVLWSSPVVPAAMAFDSHGDVIVLSWSTTLTKISGTTGATIWAKPALAPGSMWLDAADSIFLLGDTTITKYAADGTSPLVAPLPAIAGGTIAISPGHDPFVWTATDIQVLHFSP